MIQSLMSRPEPAASIPQHEAPINDDQPVQQQSNESAADSHPEDEHTAKPKKQQIFEKFLDLRKKLRRSIFRGEEVFIRTVCMCAIIDSLIVFSRC